MLIPFFKTPSGQIVPTLEDCTALQIGVFSLYFYSSHLVSFFDHSPPVRPGLLLFVATELSIALKVPASNGNTFQKVGTLFLVDAAESIPFVRGMPSTSPPLIIPECLIPSSPSFLHSSSWSCSAVAGGCTPVILLFVGDDTWVFILTYGLPPLPFSVHTLPLLLCLPIQ